jgi:chromosome segregation ATPase
MASKPEKQLKSSATMQLRKELTQATKSLQAITGSLEKLESSFTECETVLSREKVLLEENLALRENLDELQSKQSEFQRKQEQELASYADTTQALVREYDRRSAETSKKYKALQDEHQRKLISHEREWKQQLAAEKNAAQREKENESKAKSNVETQLRKTLEIQKAKEENLEKQQRELSAEVTDLKIENKELKGRLATHEAVSTGKVAEIQILANKLSSIEAFRVQKSPEE